VYIHVDSNVLDADGNIDNQKLDLNVKVDNNNFTFEWDPNDSEF